MTGQTVLEEFNELMDDKCYLLARGYALCCQNILGKRKSNFRSMEAVVKRAVDGGVLL